MTDRIKKAGYVAIVGRPNSGKSTLMNSILGMDLSIVTAKAQTTRNRIMGILTQDEGQMVFVDTPGIHRAKAGGFNAFMVAEAQQALESPDVVWYLLDPDSSVKHEVVVHEILQRSRHPQVFLLINKMDSVGPHQPHTVAAIDALEKTILESLKEHRIEVKAIHRISALNKTGLDTLLAQTWNLLPTGELFFPDPEQVSDRPTKFFVAEKIREQIFKNLGDEVPYSCAVVIENFDENAKPIRIDATIHVERDSQKGIVIGKGGLKIKEIGQLARQEIETFLGQHIFLGLKVSLLKNWTDHVNDLRRVGYGRNES